MSNTIHIPTPLRPFTDKKESVEVTGATVGELLADLTTRYEGLKKHLYADDGRLRNFVNVYLNDQDISAPSGEKHRSSRRLARQRAVVAGGAPTAPADLKVGPASGRSQPGEIQRLRHLIAPGRHQSA
jgi:molybdopterin converting factor small subunit